jgi:DNA-binding CsgD family transcriptional regulator
MLSLDPGDRVYYYDAQADVRAHLGETVFQVAWQAGASLMPSEALAHLNTVVLQSAPPLPSDSPVPRNLPAGLSQREAEVLRLLAQGLTNAEMAEKLIVSPFTVNAHLRNIYNKIGTSVRRDAIRFAHQHNLV